LNHFSRKLFVKNRPTTRNVCNEFPDDLDLIAIPVEVEEEENLGVNAETELSQHEEPVQSFDVEVDGSDSVNSDDSLSESSDSEDTEVPVLPKRMRKPSVMVGSVKKGNIVLKHCYILITLYTILQLMAWLIKYFFCTVQHEIRMIVTRVNVINIKNGIYLLN